MRSIQWVVVVVVVVVAVVACVGTAGARDDDNHWSSLRLIDDAALYDWSRSTVFHCVL